MKTLICAIRRLASVTANRFWVASCLMAFGAAAEVSERFLWISTLSCNFSVFLTSWQQRQNINKHGRISLKVVQINNCISLSVSLFPLSVSLFLFSLSDSLFLLSLPSHPSFSLSPLHPPTILYIYIKYGLCCYYKCIPCFNTRSWQNCPITSQ